jgi:pimeloyl-ACP methyl ester carboxylesterase
MPFITVNGLRLFYTLEGEGPPLLWISGLGQDHRNWWKQLPAFRDRFTCITFDNRDAGQSDEAPHPYTIAEMAADADGLLEALGFPQAHVVGLSLGGAIAQELALRSPQRLRSLILVSTYHQGDPRGTALMASWRLMKERFTPEEYFRAIFPWVFTHEDYQVPGQVEFRLQQALSNPAPQSLEAFCRQSQATASFDASGRLGQIGAPTLIVMGEQDILTPLRFARALHNGIPGSRLVVVPGAGHAMVWTHADLVNAILRGFLEEQEVGQ